jgi:hypothetical protein
MKKLIALVSCFLLVFSIAYGSVPTRVLYDDTHGQTAGNADWIPSGAYSEFADMLKANDFDIVNLSAISPDGTITGELLKDFRAVILPEPNNPYLKAEQEAVVDFVKQGGGAFIIGDHGNADRNGNGWDAVKALNEFCPVFGFKFAGDFLYEAPLSGKIDQSHPLMFQVRGIGAWAGSTFEIIETDDATASGIIGSRIKKAPYVVAAKYGKGRVAAIGDSSPFDDGTGSTGKNKLHDSYDSYMYSHPQFAYNCMMWVTGQKPEATVPSRKVNFYYEAKSHEKELNLLIDASHGNAPADKMAAFERHMKEQGYKVYYNLDPVKAATLKDFSTFIIPDPSLKLEKEEIEHIKNWFNADNNLVIGGAWDSSRLRGTKTLNELLTAISSKMRLNDDQVWDKTNKTNKPWGVLAHNINPDHPITRNVETIITWGTCSLITDKNTILTKDEPGVEILVSGDEDSFNKDGYKKIPAVMYPSDVRIPIIAVETIGESHLVLSGCCNFTDYQYPDSEINQAKEGPSPFKHQTPLIYDNMMKFLMN